MNSTTAAPPSSDSVGSIDTSDPRAVVTAARRIAMDRLAERERSEAELLAALTRRNIPADVAGGVIQRLAEEGFVDDDRFARAWVAARQRSRGLAPRALRRELEGKGVARDLIDGALAELDADSQAQAAFRLVEKKARSMTALPREVQVRRLMGLLARKGYSPDVAFTAVQAVLDAP
jgi:regulatory protein